MFFSTCFGAKKIVAMFPAYYIFNSLLLLLLMLHIIWTYFILKVLYRAVLVGQVKFQLFIHASGCPYSDYNLLIFFRWRKMLVAHQVKISVKITANLVIRPHRQQLPLSACLLSPSKVENTRIPNSRKWMKKYCSWFVYRHVRFFVNVVPIVRRNGKK